MENIYLEIIEDLETLAKTFGVKKEELLDLNIVGKLKSGTTIEQINKQKVVETAKILRDINRELWLKDKDVQLLLRLLCSTAYKYRIQDLINIKRDNIKNDGILIELRKINKEEFIKLDAKTMKMLKKYLDEEQEGQYLFNSKKSSSENISMRTVYYKINRVLEKLGYNITAELLFRRIMSYKLFNEKLL